MPSGTPGRPRPPPPGRRRGTARSSSPSGARNGLRPVAFNQSTTPRPPRRADGGRRSATHPPAPPSPQQPPVPPGGCRGARAAAAPAILAPHGPPPPPRASARAPARRGCRAPAPRGSRPAPAARRATAAGVVVGEPLQHGVGEDHVERPGIVPGRDVGPLEGTPGSRARAAATMSGELSMPATRPPGPARGESSVEFPGPQPRSTARPTAPVGTRASSSAPGASAPPRTAGTPPPTSPSSPLARRRPSCRRHDSAVMNAACHGYSTWTTAPACRGGSTAAAWGFLRA